MICTVRRHIESPPLSSDLRPSFPACQAIAFPEAIVFTFLLCAKTGRIAFPDLDIPNDVLLGAADPGIHTPLFGNLSDLLYFHRFSFFAFFGVIYLCD
jgi:hypothetical protein